MDDVPKVWDQKMEEYLGVKPKDDGEGCLQDMVIIGTNYLSSAFHAACVVKSYYSLVGLQSQYLSMPIVEGCIW